MPVNALSGKCIEIEHQHLATGLMLEPLRESRVFFFYGVIRFGACDSKEIIVMTDTHRVVIRGARLDSLADRLRDQRVKTIRALPQAEQMLADGGTGDSPVVEEIRIEALDLHGKAVTTKQ